MAQSVKEWITVNGQHIPIFEGQTKADAISNALNHQKNINDDEDRKQKQIALNAEEAITKNLENIVDKLPRVNFNEQSVEKGDLIKTPLKLDKHPKVFEEHGLYKDGYLDLKKINTFKSEEQEVNVDDLIAVQSIVSAEGVIKSVHSSGSIYVVEVEGKFYLLDGNHRAVAAKLLGKKKIKATVKKME